MEPRYIRNNIYFTQEDQHTIKNFKILIAGCGIGSGIAECLLRMGFEQLTLIDGDTVEESNLNRQNYVQDDIGTNKAATLKKRLLSINKTATIEAIPMYITPDNIDQLVINHQVAINALDFSTDAPFLFDEICCNKGMAVLHPYNLSWAGFIMVINSETQKVRALETGQTVFELNIGQYIIDCLKKDNIPYQWFQDFLDAYGPVSHHTSPPQLSAGVNLLSGMVAHIIFKIATKRPIKYFPDYYYASLHQ